MRLERGPFELAFELMRIAGNIRTLQRAGALGAGLGCLLLLATALSTETVTIAVEGKSYGSRLSDLQERVEFYSPYRDPRSNEVLTVESQSEVFEVSWSLIYWKFDKYERWNSLQPGESYRAVVTGWQIPGIGQYRNIVEIVGSEPAG